MFTGIVEERGVVRSLEGGRLTVACRTVMHDSPIGASVAVSGTCLTVVERGDDHLVFDLSAETLARTSLGGLTAGRPVNLERPVSLAARLGGHLVQGHVDGVGAIARIEPSPDGGAVLRVDVPPELLPAVVSKGSITVDGVSLTVAELHADGISIALIPHTLAATTFGEASTGDPVNLEVDVIARYVERLMERSGHG
jgi:riboflavin synthase